MGTTIIVCVTLLLICVTVCATVIMVRASENDTEKAEKENRWLCSRVDKAEKAEKDARMVIANLLDENKKLKSLIQRRKNERTDGVHLQPEA